MSEGLDPPESAPPPRPRSHRADTPVADSVRRFLAPLAAVTAVVVVIVLLLVLNGPGSSSTPGPALESPPTVTTTTSSPAATTPPPRSRSPKPRRTRAAKPTPTETVVQRLPVTVLNNSTRYHLAARAADQLAAGGWSIKQVGNFTGRIPVSTAYYAPGQESVAQALAAQFPAIQRVNPRFEGLPGSGLTLVVTREWPAGGS